MTAIPKNETSKERPPETEHWSKQILDTARSSLAAAKDSFPDFRTRVQKLPHKESDEKEPQRHLVANTTLNKLDKLLMSIA